MSAKAGRVNKRSGQNVISFSKGALTLQNVKEVTNFLPLEDVTSQSNTTASNMVSSRL